MKLYLYLLLITSTLINADVTSAVVHSSVSTYYEDKSFKNSVQKTDAVVYGVGGDIHHEKHEYKFTYEYSDVKTIRPKLAKDLEMEKIFLKYGYAINDKLKINLNYIHIDDNLAITDGGQSYGAGLTYSLNKKSALNFTQFYTDYDDFNVYQSGFNFVYKFKIDEVKFDVKSTTKYININDKNVNSFTKFAEDDYLTTGLIFHSHYKSYHLGGGAYLGKRVFGIMSDGFKIQHHAMEVDRTYALAIGKTINNFVLRFQYIYQRAEELPQHQENVEVKNLRFILNYKF